MVNKYGTFLAFDFCNKKIGTAVGNMETQTASPLQTIRSINQQPDWRRLQQLIEEWHPHGLVVGISTQADGSDNPITPRMRKFCRQLEGRYRLPVYQTDEALSTFEAKQLLYNDLAINAGKLWQVKDQLAAQLFLQSWLNEQTNTHDH
jgi:putative Holliday junction resolvase